MSDWFSAETNTHQDHVIAHVIGATVVGYFILDETAFVLLDIGFVWNIFLDGEMGLLPHPVAVTELDADEQLKTELKSDIDKLLRDPFSSDVQQIKPSPNHSPIVSVDFFVRDDSRRLVLTCENGSIVVETSLEKAEVTVNGN